MNKQYQIVKKGTCNKPKTIDQAELDKFKRSGLLRRFEVTELPEAIEPPSIIIGGDSKPTSEISLDSEPTKRTRRKKK